MAEVKQTFPTEAMAKLFDCTRHYIWELQKKGIIHVALGENGEPLRGRYDLIPTVRAYIQYLRRAAALDHVGESELNQAKLRKWRAQGEAEVLRLKTIRGELHRAEDVEAIMNDLLTGIKMRLLAIPSRIARLLLGQSQISRVMDILTDAIELALGDVLEYRAQDFYARNKAYLLNQEITLADQQQETTPAAPSNGDESEYYPDDQD
jgi:phage terminase Nu1 subunit (DNA packaging protein)